jgi:hypothetical protein
MRFSGHSLGASSPLVCLLNERRMQSHLVRIIGDSKAATKGLIVQHINDFNNFSTMNLQTVISQSHVHHVAAAVSKRG